MKVRNLLVFFGDCLKNDVDDVWLFHLKMLLDGLRQEFAIRVFPKIDHFGIDARNVLEKNKFSKKGTSNMDWNLGPRTVGLTSCVYSLMPSHLSYIGKC